jgi:glycosyltransferase involved in cell wall biosynthesis
MLVSILIPCFNAEQWVAQAIESALAQTWPEKEVIVVDDGSTDGSLEVIRRFDGRIRWETGPNRGGNAARNRLLKLSSGEWLQYLDADDYLRPGKIQRQVEFAREHPECDVIYSATASEIMENGRLDCEEHQVPEPRDPWILLAHWELPQTGGTLWKKKALQRVGGWRVGQPCCQEHELYFRLLEAGSRFEHCDCCLAVYRRWDHGARISNKLPLEVYRQRLLIMDRIEKHLRRNRELSTARHAAINDTRHATARTLWHQDRDWAGEIAECIRASDPNYYPRGQPASPRLYSVAYRILGFEAAQTLASYKRALTSAPGEKPGKSMA